MTTTTMPATRSTRGKYEGLLEIISYNRRFYALTALAVMAGIIIAVLLPGKPALLLAAASLLTLAWIAVSLLVSHYIYDRSQLYDFRWMRDLLPQVLRNWVNIHAGLDQTSELLQSVFPGSNGQILDIYNPVEMTEPSIARAREISAAGPAAIQADFKHLPLPGSSCDAVFLIFAAHELRRRSARVEFFREAARVLAAGGAVVLVEHLRDMANFLAFGPGFLHFQLRGEWLYAAVSANLRVQQEMKITPFVRVFVLVHDYDS